MAKIIMRMDPQTAARVMTFLAGATPAEPFKPSIRLPSAASTQTDARAATLALPPRYARSTGPIPYEIFGHRRSETTANAVVVDILGELARHFPAGMNDVATAVASRSRAYIARSREALIPGRPDLAERAIEFAAGWFVDTNVANRDKQAIVDKACGALGLVFGHDVKVQFPNA